MEGWGVSPPAGRGGRKRILPWSGPSATRPSIPFIYKVRSPSVQKERSMSGLPWQRGWDPFRELQREVGRIIGSFDPLLLARRVPVYPPMNLYDAGDRYVLTAQLPGLTPGDLELTITGETLTMRGERKR